MGKITNLLIGFVVLAFIFTGFIYFIAQSSQNTGLTTFNEAQYSGTYNKLGEINNLTNDIQSNSNTSVEQSTTDILGSYFKQGYSAFRLTLISGKLATDMVESSEKELQLGNSMFFDMIATIIIIIIVFGIIIYVVVGKDV